jgi:hypothetical protein
MAKSSTYFLKRGQRGLLVGKTGSGKSEQGYFHCQNAAVWPVIIFDTKIEDKFFSVPSDNETLKLIEGVEAFAKYAATPKKDMRDYILVRPTEAEFQDPEAMDAYMQVAYLRFGPVFIYIDEVGNFHKNGRALPGLMNILARGRSKGKTTLMASQRPSGISRSCITESDKFYIHRLTDMRDKQTLDYVIPDFSKNPNPPEWHFYHFDVATDETVELFAPVPLLEEREGKIKKRDWL